MKKILISIIILISHYIPTDASNFKKFPHDPVPPKVKLCIPGNCPNPLLIKHYTFIAPFYHGLAKVMIGEIPIYHGQKTEKIQYGFINLAGKEVIPPQYDYAGDYHKGLAMVEKDRRWGFIDETGKIVIPIEYTSVWQDFKNDLISVKTQQHAWGVIDKHNNIILPMRYEGPVGIFQNGTAFIIQEPYNEGTNFSEPVSKFRMIDQQGRPLSKTYDDIQWVRRDEEIFEVQSDSRYGYIDSRGKEVVPPLYKYVSAFRYGYGVVKEGDWWIAFNRKGKIVQNISEKGFYADYTNGRFYIHRPGRIFVITNIHGQVQPDRYYNASREFSEGMMQVEKNDFCGFIDDKGNEVIAPTYREAHSFSEGLAAVKQYGGYWGYIDKQGKTVIPFQYDRAESFHEDVADVMKNGRHIVINKQGCPILAEEDYDSDQWYSKTKNR